MTQTTNTYRPSAGQTLFMAYKNEMPFVVTVTGFHNDPRYTSEQFMYTEQRTGKKRSSSLAGFTFFPDAALESKFVYGVWQRSEEENYSIEEAYFFDPQSAFDHIKAIESGTAPHRFGSEAARDRTYIVQVEEVV